MSVTHSSEPSLTSEQPGVGGGAVSTTLPLPPSRCSVAELSSLYKHGPFLLQIGPLELTGEHNLGSSRVQ